MPATGTSELMTASPDFGHLEYRDDGHGRPAYDPAMMVALVLYGYAQMQNIVARDTQVSGSSKPANGLASHGPAEVRAASRR